ncbi:uncharacterized protein [Diadema setosum]|uniref:uncharacterized protein n=1 Tax=Diadema setosum TaxID=31175 RepID=UPI003B3B1B37
MMFGYIGKAAATFGLIKHGYWNYSEFLSAIRCLHSVSAKQSLISIRKPPYLSEPREKKLPTWCQQQVRDMTSESSGPSPWKLEFYRYFNELRPRICYSDQYGLDSNALYNSYFYSIINDFLILQCNVDTHDQDALSPNIYPFMVRAEYALNQAPRYSDDHLAALAVSKMDMFSVTCMVGVFTFGGRPMANIVGRCVHNFYDRNVSISPVQIPDAVRRQFMKIMVPFDFDIKELHKLLDCWQQEK